MYVGVFPLFYSHFVLYFLTILFRKSGLNLFSIFGTFPTTNSFVLSPDLEGRGSDICSFILLP